VSGLFRRRPTPAERIMDGVADLFDDLTHQARGRIAGALGSGITSAIVKASIGAVTAKVAADLVTASLGRKSGQVRLDPQTNRDIGQS